MQYVDFGNVAVVDGEKIWQIESRFMEMPVQSVRCGISNIKCVTDDWKSEEVDKIFNKESFVCVFDDFKDDKYNVQLWENDIDVKNQVIEAGLAVDCSTFEMGNYIVYYVFFYVILKFVICIFLYYSN